jgi:hypothetical protein
MYLIAIRQACKCVAMTDPWSGAFEYRRLPFVAVADSHPLRCLVVLLMQRQVRSALSPTHAAASPILIQSHVFLSPRYARRPRNGNLRPCSARPDYVSLTLYGHASIEEPAACMQLEMQGQQTCRIARVCTSDISLTQKKDNCRPTLRPSLPVL